LRAQIRARAERDGLQRARQRPLPRASIRALRRTRAAGGGGGGGG